jgi:hypothetical protein
MNTMNTTMNTQRGMLTHTMGMYLADRKMSTAQMHHAVRMVP